MKKTWQSFCWRVLWHVALKPKRDLSLNSFNSWPILKVKTRASIHNQRPPPPPLSYVSLHHPLHSKDATAWLRVQLLRPLQPLPWRHRVSPRAPDQVLWLSHDVVKLTRLGHHSFDQLRFFRAATWVLCRKSNFFGGKIRLLAKDRVIIRALRQYLLNPRLRDIMQTVFPLVKGVGRG